MLLGAHMSIAGGVDLAPERGESVGCEAIQLFLKNNNQWQGKEITAEASARFRKNLLKHHIKATVAHDCYLINLCATDPEILRKSREATVDELQRCKLLGIPYLVMHPGAHLDAGVEAGIRLIADSLNCCLAQTPRNRTMILLETTAGQGTNLGWRFEELGEIVRLVRAKKRIGVCLDTCHVFAAGYDIRTAAGWRKTMANFDRAIGLDLLKVFHLNDSKRELGSRVDRHEHLGQGCIGLEGFRAMVRSRRFRHCPGLLETPKGPDLKEDIANLARLRSLLK